MPPTLSIGDNYTVIVMKTCSKCKELKPFSDYVKDKATNDGHRSSCKTCSYAMTIEWNRSRKGVVCRLWHKHNARSATRGHSKPSYTREWLYDFVLNHPNFESLYAEWVASGYEKMLSPSIDRIDDRIGYTKENIRLVTFGENMEHAWDASRKIELDNKGWQSGLMGGHRAVKQYDLYGNFIAEFISINEACRSTGSSDSKVTAACKGNRITHNKFQWRYSDDNREVSAVDQRKIRTGGTATNKRKVNVNTLDGCFIGQYSSLVEACKLLKLNYRSVKRSKLGGTSNKGYLFTDAD